LTFLFLLVILLLTQKRDKMKVISKENCPKHDPRFIIVDAEGKVVDDAQGYGYKSQHSAYKIINYRFKGGKQRKEQKEQARNLWFKKYPEVRKAINDVYEINFKEIARGEITLSAIKKEIDEKFGINLPKEYIINS